MFSNNISLLLKEILRMISILIIKILFIENLNQIPHYKNFRTNNFKMSLFFLLLKLIYN